MRKLNLVLIALFAITLASPAFATNNGGNGAKCVNRSCNTTTNDNDTIIRDNFSPEASATGVGIAGARATGGDATVRNSGNSSSRSGALAGAGVFGSGNSDNTNRNRNSNDNTVLGIQGQLGILDSDVDVNTRVGNRNRVSNDTDVSNRQGQDQGQQQGQVGIVRDGDVDIVDDSEIVVEGDDIVYEAPEIPVNSAAPVFAGACSQGVSAQTSGFGGSAASGNPVCDYVAVAGGLTAAGERTEAVRVLGKAEDAADWRYRISQIRNVLTLGLL